MKTFNVGDTVRMSRSWLQSTQAHQYGPAIGQVRAVGGAVLLIEWTRNYTGFLKAHQSNVVHEHAVASELY